MNGVIIYEGKYGATQQYAQWLGDALRFPVFTTKNITAAELDKFDIILLGSPVYVGRLLISGWLGRQTPLLTRKKVFLFVVCGSPKTEAEKLQLLAKSNVPASALNHGLVSFLRGRIIYKKLSLPDKIVLKMGAALQKDPKKKKDMLTDFDEVKKENLASLLASVKSLYTIKIDSTEHKAATVAGQ